MELNNEKFNKNVVCKDSTSFHQPPRRGAAAGAVAQTAHVELICRYCPPGKLGIPFCLGSVWYYQLKVLFTMTVKINVQRKPVDIECC